MDTSSPTLHLTIPPEDDGRPLREIVIAALADEPLDGELLMARGGLWVAGGRMRDMDALAQAGSEIAIHRPLSGRYPDIVATAEQILYEDDDLIVLNKPAGVYVDSTPWDAEGNYHAALVRFLATRDGLESRIHLAHRLDRDTTGVLLVTKNPAVNPAIQSAFIHGKVHKEYLCLCSGAPAADSFAITTGHGRGAHGLFRVYPIEEVGRVLINGARVKEMRTRFEVERRMEGATLVRAFPETGRTHQIRLHLTHLGHPMFGDARYHGPMEWRGEQLAHHLLHAERLSLPHPRTRYPLELAAPVPEWAKEIRVTPERRRLAQQAFATIQPLADELGMLFYSRLFELDPALRGLFKHDLANQSHSLMTMLQLAIEELDAPEQFSRALHNLGLRHVEYGVEPDQYATVRAALLWTLDRALGPAYTPEVAAALAEVLGMITEQMQGKTSDSV